MIEQTGFAVFFAPLIVAPILALVLPKTWIGRGIALLFASGFVYADWQMMTDASSGPANFAGVVIGQFFLLLLYIIPVALRKTSPKTSFARLLAIWTGFTGIVIFPEIKKDLQKILCENYKCGPAEEEIQARAREYEIMKQKTEEEDRKAEQRGREWMLEICKKSGESIYRTAENVEGVLLLDDTTNISILTTKYRYVDHLRKKLDIRLYREHRDYRNPSLLLKGKLDRETYGIERDTWDDANFQRYIDDILKDNAQFLSMPRHAVAVYGVELPERGNVCIVGWAMKIIDLNTRETMAERTDYRYCGPNPSGEKTSCPQPYDAAGFLQKVLKPSPLPETESPR